MISRSSPPAWPARGGTRSESRGAVPELAPRGFVPSVSPRRHARGTRAVASGRLGVGGEPPAVQRPEPAPVLVVCAICRQRISHNETLRISYCPTRGHGLSQPFAFIPLSQRRLREA